jgi:hypothetical protein
MHSYKLLLLVYTPNLIPGFPVPLKIPFGGAPELEGRSSSPYRPNEPLSTLTYELGSLDLSLNLSSIHLKILSGGARNFSSPDPHP